MKDKLIDFLKILVTPNCWFRPEITDKEWDKKLRKELQNPVFSDSERYTVKLNGTTIWTGNYPYCCYIEYDEEFPDKKFCLPSRRTVFFFKREYDKFLQEK